LLSLDYDTLFPKFYSDGDILQSIAVSGDPSITSGYFSLFTPENLIRNIDQAVLEKERLFYHTTILKKFIPQYTSKTAALTKKLQSEAKNLENLEKNLEKFLAKATMAFRIKLSGKKCKCDACARQDIHQFQPGAEGFQKKLDELKLLRDKELVSCPSFCPLQPPLNPNTNFNASVHKIAEGGSENLPRAKKKLMLGKVELKGRGLDLEGLAGGKEWMEVKEESFFSGVLG
jgi:hypothetical protein